MKNELQKNLGPVKLPVLLTAFKRYDTTIKVVEALRSAQVPRVYFACDGGRNPEEWEKVNKVRSIVDELDWGCEVHTRFYEENRGSKWGMTESISWFFENEEEGIILEDDIQPDLSFFYFCQELLERYRNDTRVWAINGNNLMSDWKHDSTDSYYFSSHGYGAYWGWASWRRSWRQFDVRMEKWPQLHDSQLLKDYFLSRDEEEEGTNIFQKTWDESIPTAWDYQFDFAKVLAGAANIIPQKTLTCNVGFGDDGTHTVSANDARNREELYSVDFPLQHPEFLTVDKERDLIYFRRFIRTPYFRRFKNNLKSLLPKKVDNAVTPILSKIQRKLGLS